MFYAVVHLVKHPLDPYILYIWVCKAIFSHLYMLLKGIYKFYIYIYIYIFAFILTYIYMCVCVHIFISMLALESYLTSLLSPAEKGTLKSKDAI